MEKNVWSWWIKTHDDGNFCVDEKEFFHSKAKKGVRKDDGELEQLVIKKLNGLICMTDAR